MTPEEIAKEAYREYGQVTNFLNYQGLPMPEWDQLPEKIRQAWISASTHVWKRAGGVVLRDLGDPNRTLLRRS